MPDLDDRFGSLSRVRAPDLWSEIADRRPGPMPRPPVGPRIVAAVVALLIAATGFAIVASVLGRGSQIAGEPTPTPTPVAIVGSVANGPIYFRVGGGDGGSRIEAVEPDGSGRRVVFEDEPARIAQIAWSPDGSRIAYQNPIADERGIFVANPDGSDPVRLTTGANDSWPSWSPDGTQILFSSSRADPSIDVCTPAGADFRCPTDIFVVGADGSNVTRLTTDERPEYQPVWSPDGSRIAFVRLLVDAGPTAIFTMSPDGTEVRQASSADGGSDFAPSWSPEGVRIAFGSIRYEDRGIWVVDADGTNETLILGGTGAGYVDDPVWSPDGSLIAFVGNLAVDDYSPENALYVMRPDGTGVMPLADAPGVGVAGDIAWQPLPAPSEAVEPSPPPASSPLPTSAEVVETFEVGVDVRSVVYGEGSLWVAASNDDGTFRGRIVRIDPETHEVQADIPVEVIPTWEVGGGAMVVADGSLWVTGGLDRPGAFNDPGGGADAAVIRIDASTNEVVDTFALGGEVGADLTFLDGQLWVLLFGDETVGHSMEVVRVDPDTGEVLARIPLTGSWAHTIVAADGRLVFYESGTGDVVNAGGHLTSIDPGTNAVVAEIPSRYFEGGPVLWRDQVWAATEEGFARFDPVTGQFLEGWPELDPARFAFCCGFVEADDRGIWFLGYDGKAGGGERRLDLFDPATGEVTELVALDEGNPVAMAVAPDGIWVLNYDGMLTHVRLV